MSIETFKIIVTSRIEKQKADEAAKLEAQRESIRLEEERKATAKAQAEAEAILAAERAKQAEEEAKATAKVEAESRAKAEHEAAELEKQNREYLSNLADTALKNGGFQSVSESAAIKERRKQAAEAANDQRGKPPVSESERATIHSQDQVADRQSTPPTKRARPARQELLLMLADGFDVSEQTALDWILDEFAGEIKFKNRKAA